MVDYVKAAATAKRLVESAGREVTIYSDSTTPANAAKPWLGPDDSTPGDTIAGVKMAFVPPSGSGLGATLLQQAGVLVQQFDQIGLLAASSAAGKDLRTFDSVVDGGRTWKIVLVHELKPGDTSLLWVLGLVS